MKRLYNVSKWLRLNKPSDNRTQTFPVTWGHDLKNNLLSKELNKRKQPHRRHCAVSLSKNIDPSLVLVQPRKTRPQITERLLMGRKESKKKKKKKKNNIIKSITRFSAASLQ